MSKYNINKAQLNNTKKHIRNLLKKCQGEESEKICTQLIYTLEYSNIKDKEKSLWFAYYSRAQSYIIMEKYEKALKDAEETFYYIGDLNNLNERYTFSLWLTSNIHSIFGNIYEAVDNYKKLSKYYRELNYINLRIACLFNVAKLLENTKRMESLINIVRKSDKLEKNKTNLSRFQLITQMESELIEVKEKLKNKD